MADNTSKVLVQLALVGGAAFRGGMREAGKSLDYVDRSARRAAIGVDEAGTSATIASTKLGRLHTSARKVGSSFGFLKGAAKGAAAGATAAAIITLEQVTTASVTAWRQQQKANRQTQAVIKSTGQAAHVTAGDIADLSNTISQYSGIQDDTIQSGANMLLTFTNIRNEAGKGNKIFDQSTRILTDMSVALGQDMTKSAIQLGKALNDPIKGVTALRRVGVTFDDQQIKQIKTLVTHNHRLAAQKLILRELTKEFGGSARAQADGLDKLNVRWDAMKEKIGKQVLPVLISVGTWALDTIPKVAKVVNDIARGFVHGVDVIKEKWAGLVRWLYGNVLIPMADAYNATLGKIFGHIHVDVPRWAQPTITVPAPGTNPLVPGPTPALPTNPLTTPTPKPFAGSPLAPTAPPLLRPNTAHSANMATMQPLVIKLDSQVLHRGVYRVERARAEAT